MSFSSFSSTTVYKKTGKSRLKEIYRFFIAALQKDSLSNGLGAPSLKVVSLGSTFRHLIIETKRGKMVFAEFLGDFEPELSVLFIIVA